jgi:hypothetical protein
MRTIHLNSCSYVSSCNNEKYIGLCTMIIKWTFLKNTRMFSQNNLILIHTTF